MAADREHEDLEAPTMAIDHAEPATAPTRAAELDVSDVTQVAEVRRLVTGVATDAGLPDDRVDDLALAASELATNSVVHGGGRGVVRVWSDDDEVVVEVSDAGRLEPDEGRGAPAPDAVDGRGLWIVEQACDRVVRTVDDRGTTIRAAVRR